jgi:hypothetical protein
VLKIEQVCGDEDQIWTVGWGKGRAWEFESGSARFVRFVGGVFRSLQLTFVGGGGLDSDSFNPFCRRGIFGIL